MSVRLRVLRYSVPGAICPVSIAELEAMRARLELFHRLPFVLAEIAGGRRAGCALLRSTLAREGIALAGEPETWASQIATAQAAEEERITIALDTAEAQRRAAAN